MRVRGTLVLVFVVAGAIASDRVHYARAATEPLSAIPSRPLAAGETKPVLFSRGGNPLWTVSLGELSETRDRPIFSSSRRPPAPHATYTVAAPPPKPVAEPQAPNHPPFVLVGTIIAPSLRVAIFLENRSGKTLRLAMGEGRDGWTLRSIDVGEVRLQNDHRATTLALRTSPQFATTGNPAPTTDETVAPARYRKR